MVALKRNRAMVLGKAFVLLKRQNKSPRNGQDPLAQTFK